MPAGAAAAPILHTPRLTLRLPHESDRPDWLRIDATAQAEHERWLPARPEGQTPEQAFDQNLRRAHETWRDGTGCRLIAAFRETGSAPGPAAPRLAGCFNLNNIVRGVFQNADAGWRLAPDCVGQGVAFEALSALLRFAFAPEPDGLALHRIQANIIPDNTRSIALARRCGFRQEGLARRMLKIAGDWRDHLNFAILADEFAREGVKVSRCQGVKG